MSEGGIATSAGTSRLTFDLKNAGPKACDLEGYPEVALYGTSGAGGAGAGAKLAFTMIQAGPGPSVVGLAPGATTSFLLSVSEVPINGVGCEGVASVEVTPPGTTGALSVPAHFQPCGGTVGVYALTAGG